MADELFVLAKSDIGSGRLCAYQVSFGTQRWKMARRTYGMPFLNSAR